MTRLDAIVGQERPIELLRRMARSGRLPHALLFHGPEGVGKGTVARIFAAALLCERGGEEPCGACSACALAEGGRHPDQLVVTRLAKGSAVAGDAEAEESGDLRTFVLVGQIRELAHVAALAPRLARRRVFLLDPADAMNVEAQNALLKTLEEPPGAAVLLLVAARPHLLLPTVRSRCFPVAFGTLSTPALTEALVRRGIAREEAAARAALAEGRPGRALALEVETHRERRAAWLEALERLTADRSALDGLPALAAEVGGGGAAELDASLDLLESLLRDAARSAAGSGGERLLHADVAPRLAAIGARLGAVRAAGLVTSIDRLRGQLRLNLNRSIVAESLLAAIAGGPLP